MKFHPAALALCTTVALVLSIHFPAAAMDEPGFAIKRMTIAENVIDREPVAVGETFPAARRAIRHGITSAACDR